MYSKAWLDRPLSVVSGPRQIVPQAQARVAKKISQVLAILKKASFFL